MASFDVSAVAREVLSLMRSDAPSHDAPQPPAETPTPAEHRAPRAKPQRRTATAGNAGKRFGKGLDRVFGGWFVRADDEPQDARIVAQSSFEVPDKGVCNVRVFADGWASIEFPSLSSYRLNALAVRPEVWACVMQVMRSKACGDIHEFLSRHGLRERT